MAMKCNLAFKSSFPRIRACPHNAPRVVLLFLWQQCLDTVSPLLYYRLVSLLGFHYRFLLCICLTLCLWEQTGGCLFSHVVWLSVTALEWGGWYVYGTIKATHTPADLLQQTSSLVIAMMVTVWRWDSHFLQWRQQRFSGKFKYLQLDQNGRTVRRKTRGATLPLKTTV